MPLSSRLLQEWRAYWRIRPPHVWLFANRQGARPIDITVPVGGAVSGADTEDDESEGGSCLWEGERREGTAFR